MAKNKQGGKRAGSGRKKLPQGERRKTLRIFPKEKHIKECGGEESAKKIALTAIENYKKT